MLQISDLTVRYGKVQVLQLDTRMFDSGKIYAITGPNGSGKSTFLKCIAGLIRPTSGSIRLNGTDITGRITPWVGIVLQRPVLFSGTVYHNVEFGLRCLGVNRMDRNRKVQEALKRFDVARLAHLNRRCLSGGEIQRVALARTMILSPKILALDEPFSHLDGQATDHLASILRTIRNETDTTILLSTHDVLKEYELADRICFLSQGNFIEPHTRNIIHGISRIEEGIGTVRVNDDLRIEHTSDITGSVAFQIDPSAITLARERHRTSARNQLPGCIRSICREDLRVHVMVDVGIPLAVSITPQSCRDLEFKIGDTVWVSFKASAVKQIPTNWLT